MIFSFVKYVIYVGVKATNFPRRRQMFQGLHFSILHFLHRKTALLFSPTAGDATFTVKQTALMQK